MISTTDLKKYFLSFKNRRTYILLSFLCSKNFHRNEELKTLKNILHMNRLEKFKKHFPI